MTTAQDKAMKKQHPHYQVLTLALALLTFGACNLEKVVEIDLPPYEPILAVECYLLPGEPYRLALSETVSYFDSIGANLPIVSGATVVITYQGISDTLSEGIFFDKLGNLYNYGSDAIVPFDYVGEFALHITDSEGRSVTATTRLLPPVAVDSHRVFSSNDSAFAVGTYIPDDPAIANFYRKMIHKAFLVQDSLITDFAYDDLIINGTGNQIVTGSNPAFEKGDTVIISHFHISELYNEYLETISLSEVNNGNPFGQPGVVVTNIQGGTGIFTGYSMQRDTVYVPQ